MRARATAKFIRPGKKPNLSVVPSESVDYAVMERCPGSEFDIRMVPLNAGWNDLGAWDAVWASRHARTRLGNTCTKGDVHAGRHPQLAGVHANSRLVGTVGVNNLVIMWKHPTPCWWPTASRSQEVKQIVNRLARAGPRRRQLLHRKVHRPWGWYDSIDMGPRFQVKRIMA